MHFMQRPIEPWLIGCSPHVYPKPTDLVTAFGERCHFTGYWVVPTQEQMQIAYVIGTMNDKRRSSSKLQSVPATNTVNDMRMRMGGE